MTLRPPPFRPVRWIGWAILAVIVLSIAPYDLLLPKISISGEVYDRASGEPVAGARVRLGAGTMAASATTTDPSGSFSFDRAGPTETLYVVADGYQTSERVLWPPHGQRIGLTPHAFALNVRDAETNQPMPRPSRSPRAPASSPCEPGRFQVEPARDGLSRRSRRRATETPIVRYRGEGEVARGAPAATRSGTVVDGRTGQPIPGAFLTYGERRADRRSAMASSSWIAGRRPDPRPGAGYRRAEIDASQERTLVARLEPMTVRALYLTYYGVGDRGLRQNVLALAERTEVNAVVIDVKGDRGKLTYRSEVPLAEAIGANAEPTVPNIGRAAGQPEAARHLHHRPDRRLQGRRPGSQRQGGRPGRGRQGSPERLSPGPMARGSAGSIRSGPTSGSTTSSSPARPPARGSTRSSSTTPASRLDAPGGFSASQARYSSRGFTETATASRPSAASCAGLATRSAWPARSSAPTSSVRPPGTTATTATAMTSTGCRVGGLPLPDRLPSSFRTGLPGAVNFPGHPAAVRRRLREPAPGAGATDRPRHRPPALAPVLRRLLLADRAGLRNTDIDAQRKGAPAAGA